MNTRPVFLSLSLSADRTFTNCPQAWFPTANSETLDQGFGVNIHFTDPQPGEVKMIADAGFRWVRMDFVWDATERERGRYDFSAYDHLMQSLEQFKLRALFILDYGNALYGKPPRTEDARQAFARWAVAAAKHFAGRGVIWETYNEPNVPMFWPPQPNVDEYVALALTVGRAFRARSVEGKRILLVDDVMTTGSTAAACALALKKAGAQRVALLTVARADRRIPGPRLEPFDSKVGGSSDHAE